jgi:TetR/AcrR family transcriptional repressor of mexJK operon
MSRPKKNLCCGDKPALSKQDAVLAAAQEVFLEAGYAAASMDAVASRANVSKATIYAHFDNKRALFEAMIGNRCEAAFEGLQVSACYEDAHQALYELAVHFMRLIMAPEAVALHRVIIGESPRLPEVGEAFYNVGPTRARQRVTELFTDLNQRKLLDMPVEDMPTMADLFLGMMKGDMHLRAIVNVPPAEGLSIERLAEGAASLIIARYGVTS